MPLEIEYARAARIDLYEIWYFIAADNRRAADNLIRRFEAIFRNLAANPQIGRLREELGRDVRSFPHGRYLVFYQIQGDLLVVLRVLSAYRDISAQSFPDR